MIKSFDFIIFLIFESAHISFFYCLRCICILKEKNKMNIKRKRILKLIAGFLCCLCLGVTLAWSLFVVPIETLNGWTRSQTSFAFTINTLFFL